MYIVHYAESKPDDVQDVDNCRCRCASSLTSKMLHLTLAVKRKDGNKADVSISFIFLFRL